MDSSEVLGETHRAGNAARLAPPCGTSGRGRALTSTVTDARRWACASDAPPVRALQAHALAVGLFAHHPLVDAQAAVIAVRGRRIGHSPHGAMGATRPARRHSPCASAPPNQAAGYRVRSYSTVMGAWSENFSPL